MTSLALRRLGLALFAMAILAVMPSPAAGEQITAQDGITGHAGLADIQDSPGALCAFAVPGPGTLGETVIRVNPPVIFAADTTPGLDRQQVGWQARIHVFSPRDNRWVTAAESPVATGDASDQTATYFDGDAWTQQFMLTGGVYAVTVEMLWFDPAAPETVSGHMTATIERYALVVRARAGATQAGVHSTCRMPDHRALDRPSSPTRPG